MEPVGNIFELEWNAFDESELVMAQSLGAYTDTSSYDWYWPSTDHFSSCMLSDPIMIPAVVTSSESMSICLSDPNVNHFDVTNRNSYSVAVAEHVPVPKRKADDEIEDEILTENPKKSARLKSARSEEKEECINVSYSSEDNSNICQGAVADGIAGTNSSAKGKARASRGSATDPQSLYARKRRERINERLKILQNLVPNGTKVDISTMLEEAVQYVKFLQLQIKLLSSDDMWMYAPLAYNGMDIGLDIKIPFPHNSSAHINAEARADSLTLRSDLF